MENHRWSKIKRLRKSGFRKRMETKSGRKILSRKRRVGHESINITTGDSGEFNAKFLKSL